MSLLLHACCGPCAMYPVDMLLKANRDLDLYWFNPNIHPEFEWNRRLENLRIVAKHYDRKLIEEGDCRQAYWESKAYLEEFNSRCFYCYDVRLESTAKYAAEHGYEAFCTTLLVSPYQQHDVIIDTAKRKAIKYGVDFEYYDFRPGYREGQNMAREIELYRQKYCGCIYSLDESKFKEKIIKSFQ